MDRQRWILKGMKEILVSAGLKTTISKEEKFQESVGVAIPCPLHRKRTKTEDRVQDRTGQTLGSWPYQMNSHKLLEESNAYNHIPRNMQSTRS